MFICVAPLLLIDRMHYFTYTSFLGVIALIINLIIITVASLNEA